MCRLFHGKLRVSFYLLTVVFTVLAAGNIRAEEWEVMSRDMASQFTKLRMDYAARPDFTPIWEMSDERKAVIAAIRAGDVEKTMTLAGAWLAKHPIDVDVHKIRSVACAMENDWAGYMNHTLFYNGLLASIAASGGGLDPGDPMKVIAVHEEYYFLHHIGADVTNQSLIEDRIDKMECVVEGNKMTFYFDVSMSMDYIRKELKAAPKK